MNIPSILIMKFRYCLLSFAFVSASVAGVYQKSYDCGGTACVNAARLLQNQCGDRGVSDPRCACEMSDDYFIQLHECSKDCKGLQIEGYTGPNDYKKAYCLQASQENYLPVAVAAAMGTSALQSKAAVQPVPSKTQSSSIASTSKPKSTVSKSVTKTSTTGKAAAAASAATSTAKSKSKSWTKTSTKGAAAGNVNSTGSVSKAGDVSVHTGNAILVNLAGLFAFLLL